MLKSKFYKLFSGFYEQYLIPIVFMALTPIVFYENMPEAVIALLAIILGTLADISINRVYDAEDDAIEDWKREKNPISNGQVDKDRAWMFCVNMYFVSIILSLLTGKIIFAFALTIRNLFGFLYSGPPVRAKAHAFIDILFHITIIDSGPAFLAIMYTKNIGSIALYMLGFLVLNSIFTQISQEIRDLNIDRKAGLNTTAQKLGMRKSSILQKFLLISMCLYVIITSAYTRMFYVIVAGAIATLYVLTKMGGEHVTIHRARKKYLLLIILGVVIQILVML